MLKQQAGIPYHSFKLASFFLFILKTLFLYSRQQRERHALQAKLEEDSKIEKQMKKTIKENERFER